MDLNLSENVALCTAASSGLGLASAESLASEGANIAICGRTKSRLENAGDRLESVGEGEVLTIEADLTDRKQVMEFIEKTVDKFGGIDHVVTSTGDPVSGSFLSIDDKDWYNAYDLLVMSTVWTLRYSYPYLCESEVGSVVAITSEAVREVIDDLVLSNAVRRGVIGLVKTLSREFAPDVRVNALLPGVHETPPIVGLIELAVERGEVSDYQEAYNKWVREVPLDRIGHPREFGDVAAFLASDRASYINGASVPVDGGSLRS